MSAPTHPESDKPATADDGLTQADRDIIRDTLRRYPAIERAILFGSRAMGTFSRGSDIDLALEGKNLDRGTLGRVACDLEESDLPSKVDLLLRSPSLAANVEEHIRQYGRPFYCRAAPVHDRTLQQRDGDESRV